VVKIGKKGDDVQSVKGNFKAWERCGEAEYLPTFLVEQSTFVLHSSLTPMTTNDDLS
jgi:hypothetical protein